MIDSCALQVQLAVVDDGTIAIEATVHELLAQWPFLSDLSLIWAAASIFEPASPADVAATDADPAHQAAAAAAQRVLQEPAVQPWLYFNLIAHNSHIFAPVMDLVSAPCYCWCLFLRRLFSCLTYSAPYILSAGPFFAVCLPLLMLESMVSVQLRYIFKHRHTPHSMRQHSSTGA